MALRLGLILTVLAFALVADFIAAGTVEAVAPWSLMQLGRRDLDDHPRRTCNGLVGDCIDDDDEMLMDSEITRRGLQATRRRYISYAALNKNRVPCNRRGNSYYNCQKRTRANPYRRGCSVITQCKRFLRI